MPNNDNLKKLHQSLYDNGYDVPDSYERFEKTLDSGTEGSAEARRALHQSLYESGFDVPESYERFEKTLWGDDTQQSGQGAGQPGGLYGGISNAINNTVEKVQQKLQDNGTATDETATGASDGSAYAFGDVRDDDLDWDAVASGANQGDGKDNISLKNLHTQLKAAGFDVPNYGQFAHDMAAPNGVGEANSMALWQSLRDGGVNVPDYDKWKKTLFGSADNYVGGDMVPEQTGQSQSAQGNTAEMGAQMRDAAQGVMSGGGAVPGAAGLQDKQAQVEAYKKLLLDSKEERQKFYERLKEEGHEDLPGDFDTFDKALLAELRGESGTGAMQPGQAQGEAGGAGYSPLDFDLQKAMWDYQIKQQNLPEQAEEGNKYDTGGEQYTNPQTVPERSRESWYGMAAQRWDPEKAEFEDTNVGAAVDQLTGIYSQYINDLYNNFNSNNWNADVAKIQNYERLRDLAREQYNVGGNTAMLDNIWKQAILNVINPKARAFADMLLDKVGDNPYDLFNQIRDAWYDNRFQEELFVFCKFADVDREWFNNTILIPRLRERCKDRYKYDGGFSVFADPRHIAKEMNQRAADSIIQENIGQDVDEVFKKYDEEYAKVFVEKMNDRSNYSFWNLIIPTYHEMSALSAAEEARDYDKMWKDLADDAEYTMGMMLTRQDFWDKADKEMEEIGITDYHQYIENYVAPGFLDAMYKRFRESAIAREMPTSTANYIWRHVEQSIIGMVANKILYPESKRNFREEAFTMTGQGRNPNVGEVGWLANAAGTAVSMAADTWLYIGTGQLGGALANRFMANRIAAYAAERGLTYQAAAQCVKAEAQQYLGKRMAEKMLPHIISSATTLGTADAISEGVRGWYHGDDVFTTMGNMVKAGLKGAFNGVIFGAAGGAVAASTFGWSGVSRLFGTALGYTAETAALYTTGEMEKVLAGEEGAFANPFEGMLQSAIQLGGIKLGSRVGSANYKPVWDSFRKAVRHPAKTLREAMKPEARLLTQEDVEWLKAETGGKDLHDALMAIRPGDEHIASNGVRLGSIDPEELKRCSEAYQRLMSNADVPLDRKIRIARVMDGIVPPTGLEVCADMSQEGAGYVVRTRDMDGFCVAEKRFNTREEAEAALAKAQASPEFQRNRIVSVEQRVSQSFALIDRYMEEAYLAANEKSKRGGELTETDKRALHLKANKRQLLDAFQKQRAGEELSEEEQTLLKEFRDTCQRYVNEGAAVKMLRRDFEQQSGYDKESTDAAVAARGAGERDGGVELKEGQEDRTDFGEKVVDDYLNYISEYMRYQELQAEAAAAQDPAEADALLRQAKAELFIDGMVWGEENGGDGMIHPVTLTDGRKVYVTGGHLEVREDGTIDMSKSSPDVTIYDASGKPGIISTREVTHALGVIDPERMRETAERTEEAQQPEVPGGEVVESKEETIGGEGDAGAVDAGAAGGGNGGAAYIEGDARFAPGRTYEVELQGRKYNIEIVGEKENGKVDVRFEGEDRVEEWDKEVLLSKLPKEDAPTQGAPEAVQGEGSEPGAAQGMQQGAQPGEGAGGGNGAGGAEGEGGAEGSAVQDEYYQRYRNEQGTVDRQGGLVADDVSENALSEHWRGALHVLGRNIGRRIRIVSGAEARRQGYGAANGWYNPKDNTIYLNAELVSANNLESFVTGHEITHVLKRESPELYKEFVEAVRRAMGEKEWQEAINEVRIRYKNYIDNYNKDPEHTDKMPYQSEEEIIDEVCCDWAGRNVLKNPKGAQAIVESAERAGLDPRKVVRRVLDWLKQWRDRLLHAKSNGEDVDEQLSDVDEALRLWQGMYDEAAARAAARAEMESPMPTREVKMRGKGTRTKPDWDKVRPERAHKYIYEEQGLSKEDADAFVDNNLKAVETELAKLRGKKPKMGDDIDDFKADTAAWENRIKELEGKRDYWQKVKDIADKRTQTSAPVRVVSDDKEPMPMTKDNNGEEHPDWEHSTPARGLTYMQKEMGLSEPEVVQIISNNAQKADKALQDHNKTKPTVDKESDPLVYRRKKDAWEKKHAQLRRTSEYWNEMREERKARQRRAAEEKEQARRAALTPEERAAEDAERKRTEEELRRKQQEASERNRRMEEAKAIDARRRREEAYRRKVEQLKKKYGDHFDSDTDSPRTVKELIALNLPSGISWDSIQKEMGRNFSRGRRGDIAMLSPYISKDGRLSFDEAVHAVWESEENMLPDETMRWDTDDIRNAMIEFLQEVRSVQDVREYILRNREADAQASLEAEERAIEEARDDWYMEHYNMTYDEHEAYLKEMAEQNAEHEGYYGSEEFLKEMLSEPGEIKDKLSVAKDPEAYDTIAKNALDMAEGRIATSTGVEREKAQEAQNVLLEAKRENTMEHRGDRTVDQGIRFSLDTHANQYGMRYVKGEDGRTHFYQDKGMKDGKPVLGKEIKRFKPEHVQNTPVGAVLKWALREGLIDKGQFDLTLKNQAAILNYMVNTPDLDMFFAVSGAIGFGQLPPSAKGVQRDYYRIDSNGKLAFVPYKSNSEVQYDTTFDVTTICRKTQTMIDVMSQVMKDLQHGLTVKEVIKIVYDNVYKMGRGRNTGGHDIMVPCNVCYVFNRWVNLGNLFDSMRRLRDQYSDMSVDDIKAERERVMENLCEHYKVTGESELFNTYREYLEARDAYQAIEKGTEEANAMRERLNTFTKKKGKLRKAMERRRKEAFDRIDKLNFKIFNYENAEDKSKATAPTEADYNELADLRRELNYLDKATWFDYVRLQENYVPIPDEVLFDINKSFEFKEKYPGAWKYRTTRGSGMGKAAAAYSPEFFGSGIVGRASGPDAAADMSKNVFLARELGTDLNWHYKYIDENTWELKPEAVVMLRKARDAASAQNYMSGQRLQSTSDTRVEYLTDYNTYMLEQMVMGSKVQGFTKVPECAKFFGDSGAMFNMSLIARGKGYEDLTEEEYESLSPEDKRDCAKIDGVWRHALYSDVSGINHGDAFALNDAYPNLQPIMVTLNNIHTRLCLELANRGRIPFNIMYHASGDTPENFISKSRTVGEEISPEANVDYTKVETDQVKDPNDKHSAMVRSAFSKIKTGKEFTQAERDYLLSLEPEHPIRQLYMRFRGEDVDGSPARILNKYLLPEDRGEDGYGTVDHQCRIPVWDEKTGEPVLDADGNPVLKQVTLPEAQSTLLMPNDYWDKTLTLRDADKNGGNFLDMCDELGLYPRFGGWYKPKAKGGFKYDRQKDFSDAPGYWSSLIDISMYDLQGKPYYQRPVDASRIGVQHFDKEQMTKLGDRRLTPMEDNPGPDSEVIKEIVGQTVKDVRARREQDKADFVNLIDDWISSGKRGRLFGGKRGQSVASWVQDAWRNDPSFVEEIGRLAGLSPEEMKAVTDERIKGIREGNANGVSFSVGERYREGEEREEKREVPRGEWSAMARERDSISRRIDEIAEEQDALWESGKSEESPEYQKLDRELDRLLARRNELARELKATRPAPTAAERRELEKRGRERFGKAKELAGDWAKKLQIDGICDVYDSIDDVPGSESWNKRRRSVKGWYDPQTGRISIVMGNHRSPEDVVKTVLHDAVGHHGLRELFGEHFDDFLDNVRNNVDLSIGREIERLAAEHESRDRERGEVKSREDYLRTATEEYLARLAEDTDFEGRDSSEVSEARLHAWGKVKQLFLSMLDKLGLKGMGGKSVQMGDNELRYILWRSYKNLESPGEYRDVFKTAEDVAMRDRLGIDVEREGAEAEGERAAESVVREDASESEAEEGRVMFSATPEGRQGFGSAATSLNQTPAGMRKVEWKSGTTNVDIGGGRFDTSTEYLREKGVENLVFDPFNRDAEHNREVAERIRNEKTDTATCHNVLNVIDSESARANVILQAAKAIKPEGTAYFTVYEGDKSGVGRQTQKDSWQNNRPTKDYVSEIEKYFDDVKVKGKVIVAKSPKETTEKSLWDFDGTYSGNNIMFSISPAEDAEYMDAVEKGDSKRAAEMVKEAARRAMAGTKVVDENGEPMVVYHGTTNGKFFVFDNSKGVSRSAIPYRNLFVFGSSQNTANTYRMGRSDKPKTGEKYGESTQQIKHIKTFDSSKTKKKDWKLSFDELVAKYPKDSYGVADPYGQYHWFDTEGEAKSKLDEYKDLEYSEGQELMAVYLDLQNPYVFDANGMGYREAISELAKKNPNIAWVDKDDTGNWIGGIREDLDGYDGLIIKNVDDNGNEYKADISDVIYATSPNQIKSADPVTYDDAGRVIPLSERFNPEKDDIRFSIGGGDDVFVSNAMRAVEGIKQEKASPSQWLAMIQKAGGLKAGEDKWMGLSDWLKGQDKKSLTKDEVLAFIRENQVQIEEVEYEGGASEYFDNPGADDYGFTDLAFAEMERRYGLTEDDFYDYQPFESFKFYGTSDVVLERARRANSKAGFVNESYYDFEDADDRDAFISEVEKEMCDDMDKWMFAENENIEHPINSTRLAYTTDGLENKKEIALTVPTIEPWNENDQIHFGDAGGGRAVAWVRFGETTDADGNRVLVIDEIQSKRHQDAREVIERDEEGRPTKRRGYRNDTSELRKKMEQKRDERAEIVKEILHRHGYSHWNERSELPFDSDMLDKAEAGLLGRKEEMERIRELEAEMLTLSEQLTEERQKIPAAPFETNWHELAMKRMLRYAAENGYDKVAWTKGAQQAERYNIGNAVDSIVSYDFPKDGTKKIEIHLKGGGTMPLVVDSEGKVVDGRSDTVGKTLSDVVGKDLARRIMTGEGKDSTIYDDNQNLPAKVISGEGLRIGSEGMEGFYDQMLPRFMDKYGKKWGVKTGEVTLPEVEEAGRTMWAVDVTPEMKESVMGGQVMFNVAADDNVAASEGYDEGRMTSDERMAYQMAELARMHQDDLDLKRRALRDIGKQLAELTESMLGRPRKTSLTAAEQRSVDAKVGKAAREQMRFDKQTVDRIVRLARTMMDSGLYNNFSPYEVRRLMGMVNRSVGSEDIANQAREVVDMLVDHQLHEYEAVMKSLMKVKGSKVNSQGVEVQAGLDVRGQRVMRALKEGMDIKDEKMLAQRIAECEDRMSSDREVVRKNAEAEYEGLLLAKQYHDDIGKSKQEERDLRHELRIASEEVYDYEEVPVRDANGEEVLDANGDVRTTERRHLREGVSPDEVQTFREYEEEVRRTIRENRAARLDLYRDFVQKVGGQQTEGMARAHEWTEQQKARVNEIRHNANSDLEGMNDSIYDELPVKDGWRHSFWQGILAPLSTPNEMFRYLGNKHINGEGYLWNRYVLGYTHAADNYWNGWFAQQQVLDAKAREIFGDKIKRWSDLFDVVKKLPGMTIQVKEGMSTRNIELGQGNLMYLYMVNKMADGRMKLRRMGITEQYVAVIKEHLDPRLVALADWIQGEYLPSVREKYNATHERLFGAPMAAIEDYFPLKLSKRGINKEQTVDNYLSDDNIGSTFTGSIIKRTKNAKPLDLTADALDVVLEHINTMEHWNAYAEMNKDMNTLLSYRRFQNRLMHVKSVRYGTGEEFWENFKKACAILSDNYRPEGGSKGDKMVTNAAKFVTAAKIQFRVFTAMKQLLSAPAFLTEARLDDISKSVMHPKESWDWAIKNLPGFAKRWQSRLAGDTRLMKTASDYKIWQSKMIEKISRMGMSPNAFVDALTVACGARGVYETAKREYLKQGYPEELAEKKALDKASVSYNESQQSSENAFTSAVQLDRTVMSVMWTVFRNASMGYERRFVRAIDRGKRLASGSKEDFIDFMSKEIQREWNAYQREKGIEVEGDEVSNEAKAAAERVYNKSVWKTIAEAAMFGVGLQFLWNLGPGSAYLVTGNDDEKKKAILWEAFRHSWLGPIEGLYGGNVASDIGNFSFDLLSEDGTLVERAGKKIEDYEFTQLPLAADIRKVVKKFVSGEEWAATTDLINLAIQSRTGVNPETFTNAVVAILDASNGDFGLAKEAGIAAMRILNVPQSAIDELYIDELGLSGKETHGMTFEEIAKRYIDYKRRREAPIPSMFYGEGHQAAVDESLMKRFTKMAEERMRGLSDDALKGLQTDDPVLQKMRAKMFGKKVEATTEDMTDEEIEQGFADADTDTRKAMAKRYAKNHDVKDPRSDETPDHARLLYQDNRDYVDLAEDILIEEAKKAAKANGDKDLSDEITQAYKDLTDDIKLYLEDVDANDKAEIARQMEKIRNSRRQILKELGIK